MRRALRSMLLALLFSLLAGFALGTCLRREAERPTEYIGAAPPAGPARSPGPGTLPRRVAGLSMDILP